MTTFSQFKCVAAGATAVIVCLVMAAHADEQQSQPGLSAKNTLTTPTISAASTAASKTAAVPDGKELFHREWIPNDPRSHGGDGLGPVFNDSSCVACHNLGGSGGGGPANKNVDIITAFVNPAQPQQAQQQPAARNLPAVILSALVQSVAPNRGTQILSSPQQSTNFEIHVSSDAQQNADSQDQAANGAQSQAVNSGAPSAANPPAANNAPSVANNAQPAASNKPSVANNAPPTAGHESQPAAISAAAAHSTLSNPQPNPEAKLAEIKRQKAELAKIHPGFLSAHSVVLHRFSTNEKYEAWRMQMLGLGQNVSVDTGDFTVTTFESTATCDPNSTTISIDRDAADGQCTKQAMEIHVVSDVEAQQKMQQLKTQVQVGQAQGLQGQVGSFSFVHSRRNPTALFGVGLIDQIPDQALIDQSKQQFKNFPEIQGRVAKMKDGKIGRFGWKDQEATLYDFAMTACAVELGLDVPDQPQAGLPLDPNYKPKGHDMDQAECDALVAYLRNLPAPVERKPASSQEAKILSAGEKQFAAVGCANCHVKSMGNVSGIYSDLLLHDMGPELGDSGNYGVFVPDTPEEEQQAEPVPSLIDPQAAAQNPLGNGPKQMTKAEREKTFGALRQEWRTPPLWGVRDSGPYLHDGRAETLEQAIAFHGGEASNSAKQFFMLKPDERAQVIMFLKSLIAPEQLASAQ